MNRVLLACLGLLLAGCSNPITQGEGLSGQFGDTLAAWEQQGYQDYTARFAVRRTEGDDFRVIEVVASGGVVISCDPEGDWTDLWVDPAEVCADPETNPILFMLTLLGSVDADHLAVSLHDDGYFLERAAYDDPDRTGEERLVTVLRLDAVPTRLAFWKQNAPDNYEIVYSRANLNGMGGSSGDGIFEVTVRDGKVVECVAQMNRQPSSQTECRPAVSDPISILFFWLAGLSPDHTEVTYDPVWRFPTEAFYDDPNGVDEETLIRVHRFEVLEDL
jgi:hypothetical protein